MNSKNRLSNCGFVIGTKVQIGHRKYNPEKAKRLAVYITVRGDGMYWSENLFKKRGGELFLFSFEGRTSDLRMDVHGRVMSTPDVRWGWMTGKALPIIQPLSESDAREWARKRSIEIKI